VVEAIREGRWDFEPQEVAKEKFESTAARPGSKQKVEVLAARIGRGEPLWHPLDPAAYDGREEE
jgi:hypothetical protein